MHLRPPLPQTFTKPTIAKNNQGYQIDSNYSTILTYVMQVHTTNLLRQLTCNRQLKTPTSIKQEAKIIN
jgi:hypothetical protein